MTTPNPITPPLELVQQWEKDWHHSKVKHTKLEFYIAFEAAQWGADQELEACCKWLVSEGWFRYEHEAVQELRATRRPKPPSLKQQALVDLNKIYTSQPFLAGDSRFNCIRRALEQLDD
jgi:hypothetical protein